VILWVEELYKTTLWVAKSSPEPTLQLTVTELRVEILGGFGPYGADRYR